MRLTLDSTNAVVTVGSKAVVNISNGTIREHIPLPLFSSSSVRQREEERPLGRSIVETSVPMTIAILGTETQRYSCS